MDALIQPETRGKLIAQNRRIRKEADFGRGRTVQIEKSVPARLHVPNVHPADRIPVAPPSWGPRVVHSMPLGAVFQHLAKNELFRLSWGAKNTHGNSLGAA